MKSRIGIGTCEIDPKNKYYKAAGFKGKMKSHYEYIEDGRRPWLYRNGGKSVVPFDKYMPYPRLCAHRGFSAALPENTMVSFGAAVALGASEIEFDLWVTSDGELVSCHDATLDRVSNGTGKIYEKTLSELKSLDFGVKYGEKYKGLKIATFEEILAKFASQTVMNIHYKPDTMSDETLGKIAGLLHKYDCDKHIYLMIASDEVIGKVKSLRPEIKICVGEDGTYRIVERAIELGCEMVQIYTPDGKNINKEMIDRAHAHGIGVNVFYSDTVEFARELLNMGADTILTNDYLMLSNALGIK
jgi:glycerophosphoryl diester phosphodiesterase